MSTALRRRIIFWRGFLRKTELTFAPQGKLLWYAACCGVCRPWIEIGLRGDGEAILETYRRFLLEEMNPLGDSRKPLIFYNSWHVQEGKKYFCGDSYLKYLNDVFILRDAASSEENHCHPMGEV